MKKIGKIVFFVLLFLALILATVWFFQHNNIVVLNPKGLIAHKQRNLLIISTLLMLIVVIPVFIMTLVFPWKYQAKRKASYKPDWDYNLLAESIWWGFPFVIVVVLSIFTWKSSHELDPFKPISANADPIVIQVVALQWKWLFIYPEQKIASVNFVQFPEQTPINFEITADAPMNSFWIPQLGGQIYAMPGMNTKLHLIANETGNFAGSSANLSGRGFAGMRFIAKASSKEEFAEWVHTVKQSAGDLSLSTYNQLVEPSENNPATFYLLKQGDFYEQIIMKYMMPMPIATEKQ